ncbi:MAG TPA: hypothetical protein VH144_01165 [Candidatus Saccharimonadales bacterium]|nr:hypothetical protein [Candidatus Saccharimonadales bacterium]
MNRLGGRDELAEQGEYIKSPVIFLGRKQDDRPHATEAAVAKVSWRSEYYGESNPRTPEGYAYISYGTVKPNDPRYLGKLGESMNKSIVYGKWDETQFTAHSVALEIEQRFRAGKIVSDRELATALDIFDSMQENLEKILVDAQDLYLNPRG